MVLRVADGLYLYETGDDGSVVLADDDYAFVDRGIWHSIAPLGLAGDMNDNGAVENTDITAFVDALRANGNQEAFLSLYPDGVYEAADINMDGNVNNLDISSFADLLMSIAAASSSSERGDAGISSILATARAGNVTARAAATAESGHDTRSQVASWLEDRLGRTGPFADLEGGTL